MANVNIITPEVEVITELPSAEKLTEYVGRVCYNSYDKIINNSYIKFNYNGAKKGHRSIFEFNQLKISLSVPDIESDSIYGILDECRPFIEYETQHNGIDVDNVQQNIIHIYGSIRAFIELLEKYIDGSMQDAWSINVFEIIYDACKLHGYNILTGWPTYTELNEFYNNICSFSTLKYESVSSDITGHIKSKSRFKKLLVKIVSDKGVHNEMVRHRPCSFMAESQRYVRYGGKNNKTPLPVCIASKHAKNADYVRYVTESSELSFNAYKNLLNSGFSPQLARAVLPVGTAMTYFVYANIKEWEHIFRLRTAKPALPMMQEITKEIRDKFINKGLI
jgi:thymidylate synthase (FAD)